ncbi:hypothetical protein BJ912DRAFT_1047220 [Pholiota molesta]|nr:hypothetical protein BJ912DRAFT_1047220 [Pholiota molesta]
MNVNAPAANPPLVTIPLWLQQRIQSLNKKPIHYEASFYGPIGMFLHCYFPADEGFMIKPQCRLREAPEPGQRTSVDSYDQTVGTSDRDDNPDFLVSTASGNLHGDIPIIIYEIKRNNRSYAADYRQIERYIKWARTYQAAAGPQNIVKILAVLVLGGNCETFELKPGSLNMTRQEFYVTGGPNIRNTHQRLHDLHRNPVPPGAGVVPAWLLERFQGLNAIDVHYEASLYGPTYALLTCYFPAIEGFLVKPQARLQTADIRGSSTDSYGQRVRTSPKDDNPDFLVSKSTADLQGDVPFLIVEMKRNSDTFMEDAAQLDRYMQWGRNYQRNLDTEEFIWAVLVRGARSEVHVLEPGVNFVQQSRTYETAGDENLNHLQSLHDLWV